MELCKPTLNPFAVAYVPLAKREAQDVDKECNTIPGETVGVELNSEDHPANTANGTRADIPLQMDSNIVDEESEIDLAYLQMLFPGVSDQSLADVYNVNGGDLEESVYMLSQLESPNDQAAELNSGNALVPVSAGKSSTSCGSPGLTAATSQLSIGN